MNEVVSFSINSVYTDTPPVLVTKIKDEITGTDKEALITEHAMVNYVDKKVHDGRYVPLHTICCNYPDIKSGHIIMEHIRGMGWCYTINPILYRKYNPRVLDYGERKFLQCVLKYLSKYFFFDVTGQFNSYAHLVPPVIPEHFYDGAPDLCRKKYK